MAGKNKVVLSFDAVQHCYDSEKDGKRFYSRELNIYFPNGYSLNKSFTSDNAEKCDGKVKSFLRELRRQIDEELDYLEG